LQRLHTAPLGASKGAICRTLYTNVSYLNLLRARKVDPRPLISRTFPLTEAPGAIEYAQQPGVMKVLLEPAKFENLE